MRYGTGLQTEYDVSVVLCTKDRAPLLDQMLVSLSDAIQGISCEMIVVDGGSSDNTLEVLKRHGVTKIYNEAECLGPGKHSWPQLYNFAFAKARGKWAMYASDDIIFGKGCITQAVESLNQQTDEIAGGVFFYKNLHEKSCVEKFYTGKYFIGFSCGQKLIINYGLFRMDYFRGVGGLDERYRFYCADGDLCLKLYESGKQLVPLPQCFVIHNNVLDVQKKSSEEGLKDDDSLYRQRWRHFVSADDPNPRRLLWQPDFVEAFALPAALRPVDSGIEYFWHGIACLQRGMFEMALEKFAQAMRTSCRHWVVLWYSAKAAYGCGNLEVAKKAAQMVVKHAPEFNQARQFLAGLDGLSSTLRIDKIDECLKQALVDRFEWVNESPTLSQAGDTQWMKNMRICQDTPDIDKIGFDNCDPKTNGEYALIPYLIKPGDVVFDVGANKGAWSKCVLSTVSPVHVHSFEPVADTFALLKDKLGDSGASLHNTAISDSEGEKTFFYYNQSSQSAELSSFYRRSFTIEQSLRIKPIAIPVQTRTLDSFCKEHLISHIDFLKIDTEGGELDVLKGAVGLLKEFRIRKLQFEYGGTYQDAGITLQRVCRLLSSYGYTIFRILPDGLVHIGCWRDSLENNLYSNYLVVSPERINDYGPMKDFSDSKTEPHYKAKAETVPQTDTLSQLEAAGLWRQGQPLRLHLGCGSQRLDDYINIDYPPDKHTVVTQQGADFYADITKLSFPAESVDEVRLHHVFEHFNRGVALGLLVQWHRWLKIGAKLHIETPDALGCARMLASNISYKIKQGILRHIFGSHEAEWAFHYDGWYDEKFQKTLSSLGFEVTCHTSKWQHEPYLANVKAVAIKRKNLSREQLLVVCDRLLLDSMVADVPAERRMHEIWCQEIRAFQNDDVPVHAAQEQHHLQSLGRQRSIIFTAGKNLSDFDSSCSEEVFS